MTLTGASIEATSIDKINDFVETYRNWDPENLVKIIKARLPALQRQQEIEDEKRLAAAEKRAQEAREAEERYRNEHICDRFYTGKVISFKPTGFIYFGNSYDAVVLGTGNGLVSFKITEGQLSGRVLETSCANNQIR